jgi:hypothetical protein
VFNHVKLLSDRNCAISSPERAAYLESLSQIIGPPTKSSEICEHKGVPSSLREIYKVSNRNRKKNKQKKKVGKGPDSWDSNS